MCHGNPGSPMAHPGTCCFYAVLHDWAGSRVCGGRARSRIVTNSRILSQTASRAFIYDTIPKYVTNGDGSAAGSGLARVQVGSCPTSDCRPCRSRRVGWLDFLRVCCELAGPYRRAWAFSRDFCQFAEGWIPSTTRRAAQSRAGAERDPSQSQSAEQRNTDARIRERRSMDAPPRRHRPPTCRVWGRRWVSARGRGRVA